MNAARRQQKRLPPSSRDEHGNDDCGLKIDRATVCHIQVVTSLIEGRFVGLAEIFAMLDHLLRQRSMGTDPKLVYNGLCHQKTPP
ncbi:MAG: hypothetical protein R3274_04030 [Desulfobacterales bacterium]|nr:hypothetical protein [Desulfobacterales bacterium]